MTDPKETLVRYLQRARDSVLWKLDGLSEHDVRRPLTRTGTNLLGLVKHLASLELGYFGETFGRPSGLDLPWHASDADPNDDLWAPPNEAREWVIGLYHQAWAHAAVTFEQNDLQTIGRVRHWGDKPVTLHQILVHVTTETHRHAGHADILREMIDGSAGFLPGASNLPEDGYDWPAYVAKVSAAAEAFH